MTIQEIRNELIEEQEENRRLKNVLQLNRKKLAVLTRAYKIARTRASDASKRAEAAESAIETIVKMEPVALSASEGKHYIEIRIPKTEISEEEYNILVQYFFSLKTED